MAISAITLAELSAGPHEVRSDVEQDAYDERAERTVRIDTLADQPMTWNNSAYRCFDYERRLVSDLRARAARRSPSSCSGVRTA